MKITVSIPHLLGLLAFLTIAIVLVGGMAIAASLSDAAIQTTDLAAAPASALGR